MEPGATIRFGGDERTLRVELAGRLDAAAVARLWPRAHEAFASRGSKPAVIVDGAGVEFCDGSGASLVAELARRSSGDFRVESFPDAYRSLLEIFDARGLAEPRERGRASFFEEFGRSTVALAADLREQVAFVGELLVSTAAAIRSPRRIRWRDVLDTAETAGVNALPIVVVIGFLLGLVLAFQSAMPMREFGAEIYVANLLGVSLMRELGPLMTAIILAGRTGSAFAAEIGTMRVNEEIDALTTMGVEPVRFLAVSRLLAAMFVTPILSCFCILAGLMGGAVVVLSLGIPLVVYVERSFDNVDTVGFLSGVLKAVVFAMIIASVGCQRGIRTGTGARAVGESTTSAVVSAILLVAIADAVFAVVLYSLDI